MYRRVVVQYFLLLMVFWSTTFSDGHNTLKKSSTTPRTGNSKNETVVDGMATEPRGHHQHHHHHTNCTKTMKKTSKMTLKARSSFCQFGLCEDLEEYPEEKIRNLLKRFPSLQQYFPPTVIVSRDGIDLSGKEIMCNTKTFVSFPKMAINKEQKEKFVVNLDEYKQEITSEVCDGDGDTCKFSEYFPTGKKAVCEQKYATTKLMVLEKGEQLVFDSFDVPSCCVCSFERD